MNIKNIIKKSKYGILFATIGLIFIGISSVIAMTYESTNTTYTTTYNSNVATAYDALNDLYSLYSAVPRVNSSGKFGMVSYKYWMVGDSYVSNYYPDPAYDSVAELNAASDFSDFPVYIKTILVNSSTTTHEVCIYYNNVYACLPIGFWGGDLGDSSSQAAMDATEKSLIRFFESKLDLHSLSCSSTNGFSACIYSNNIINIQVSYQGKSQITYYNTSLSKCRTCYVYLSNTTPRANCYDYDVNVY